MRRIAVAAVAALCCVLLAAPAGAIAASRAPKLAKIRCVPVSAATCRTGVAVRIGKQVQLSGTRLKAGMRVTFRWSKGAIATKLHRGSAGWVARVPPGVRPGSVQVTTRDSAGRKSNTIRITVLADAKPVTAPAITGAGSLPAAFQGNGMWIWQLEKSEGGDVDKIAARAAAAGITTVFVKAGDGTTAWDQFSALLVGALHAHGLKACAWQYVYGSSPSAEAAVAAAAVHAGADCFVIDAEKEYEGRYRSAQTYMTALRAAVGASYPVGLTSFPYVDYHPDLPYSVFLAPGTGAQANLPQAYWKDIGGSVDTISAHTLAHNRIYQTPIAPLGQTYDDPPASDIARFRQLWAAYGAQGLSWWSWQATDSAHWADLDAPALGPSIESDPGWPVLGKGAKGDEVIWLQEHLTSTYPAVSVSGRFDSATVSAVDAVQTANGIGVSGTTDSSTWQAALKLPFTATDWTASASASRARASAARVGARHRPEIPRVDSPQR
jgi:peptidoglycan hydrolase-like protein with peptidoglycan-binding domain